MKKYILNSYSGLSKRIHNNYLVGNKLDNLKTIMAVRDVYYNMKKGHNAQMSPTGNAIYDPHPSPYSCKRIKTILGSHQAHLVHNFKWKLHYIRMCTNQI